MRRHKGTLLEDEHLLASCDKTENDGGKQTVATRGGNRYSLRPDMFLVFIHQLCPHDHDKLVDDQGNKEDSNDVKPSKSVEHG